jgi:hypothetical protein
MLARYRMWGSIELPARRLVLRHPEIAERELGVPVCDSMPVLALVALPRCDEKPAGPALRPQTRGEVDVRLSEFGSVTAEVRHRPRSAVDGDGQSPRGKKRLPPSQPLLVTAKELRLRVPVLVRGRRRRRPRPRQRPMACAREWPCSVSQSGSTSSPASLPSVSTGAFCSCSINLTAVENTYSRGAAPRSRGICDHGGGIRPGSRCSNSRKRS